MKNVLGKVSVVIGNGQYHDLGLTQPRIEVSPKPSTGSGSAWPWITGGGIVAAGSSGGLPAGAGTASAADGGRPARSRCLPRHYPCDKELTAPDTPFFLDNRRSFRLWAPGLYIWAGRNPVLRCLSAPARGRLQVIRLVSLTEGALAEQARGGSPVGDIQLAHHCGNMYPDGTGTDDQAPCDLARGLMLGARIRIHSATSTWLPPPGSELTVSVAPAGAPAWRSGQSLPCWPPRNRTAGCPATGSRSPTRRRRCSPGQAGEGWDRSEEGIRHSDQ